MDIILSTLIYAVRDGAVLLMHRNKEPNLGLWVAPGGKLEPGESPYECAVRELREETNLTAVEMVFRGLITEVSPRPDWQWMLFIYIAPTVVGEVRGDDREGSLRWWPLGEAHQAPMPEADQIFFPRVIDLSQPFVHARYVYDADLRLIERIEHPPL
jgi:8-oxo-dGTP pyrophosphatase MutT (NUDIX family)